MTEISARIIRSIEASDYAVIAEWLQSDETLLQYVGSDLTWFDFDPESEVINSPCVEKNMRGHVLIENDNLIGAVFTYPQFSYPWCWGLEVFVSPKYRSIGVGFDLTKYGISDAFDNSFCTLVTGMIADDNPASLNMFGKFGDVVVGHIDDFFERKSTNMGATLVAMKKERWNDAIRPN